MHGAGLSVAISCQKSTMNTCASFYITKKENTRTHAHTRTYKTKEKSERLSKKHWSQARTSSALQPIFAQMASTVACHIVLPQGCAAGAIKEILFVGLSPCYTDGLFKHTLIRERCNPKLDVLISPKTLSQWKQHTCLQHFHCLIASCRCCSTR